MNRLVILEEKLCFKCKGNGRHLTEEAKSIEATLQRGLREMTGCGRPQLKNLIRGISSLDGLLAGYSAGDDLTEECQQCDGTGRRYDKVPLTAAAIQDLLKCNCGTTSSLHGLLCESAQTTD